MKAMSNQPGRRRFIKSTAIITTGLFGAGSLDQFISAAEVPDQNNLFVIGPTNEYSLHIGVLVSMLNYNRYTIISLVKSLSKEDLDYLHDPQANTIGSLLMHLGAIEKFYQVNTFEGRQSFNEKEKEIWGSAMNLGAEARENIKGHEVQYYLDRVAEVRQYTLNELKKKDDKWLLSIDPTWSKETSPNTYWKWFHVCEHESHHRGQIAWLKSRLPSANRNSNK